MVQCFFTVFVSDSDSLLSPPQIARNGLSGVVRVLRQSVEELTGRVDQLDQRPIRLVLAEPFFQAGTILIIQSINAFPVFAQLSKSQILQFCIFMASADQPWHHLYFWYVFHALRDKGLLHADCRLMPGRARLRGRLASLPDLAHSLNAVHWVAVSGQLAE